MSGTYKYHKHIDGLRAIAVLLVIFLHLGFNTFSGGIIGVDVFFVISGYLITTHLIDEINKYNNFSFINFYHRRAKRIIPALFFTIILVFISAILLFSPGHLQETGNEITSASLSFSNIYFWTQCGYFDLAAQFKPLLNTWSLGVEEQFYLIWPIVLFWSIKKFKVSTLKALITIGAGSLLINLIFQSSQINALYYLMPFRVFEFSIGGILACYKYKSDNNTIHEALNCLGLALIISFSIMYNKNTLFPSYNAIAPCIGAALIIHSGNAKYSGKLLANPVARIIGLISYSLYLIHWPIIVFVKQYYSKPLTLQNQFLIFFSSLAIAYVMYKAIEQPFRNRKRNGKKETSKSLAKYLILLLFSALIGLSTLLNHGWVWRLGASEKKLANQAKNSTKYHAEYFGGVGYPYPGWTYNNGTNIADVVLLGDSHAQMLQHGIYHEIAKPYNISVYMSGTSCLPLPNFTRLTHQKDWNKLCPEALNNAISQLHKNPKSILILSDRWANQIKIGGVLSTQKSFGVNLNSKDYQDYRIITSALDKLRTMIGKRELLIIGDVPGAGIPDGFDCLTRPMSAPKYCLKNINSNYKEDAQLININNILKKYAEKTPNTKYINPFDIFCDQKSCESFDSKGLPYYSDQYHLSKTGSIYFIKKLIKNGELNDIINKKKSN